MKIANRNNLLKKLANSQWETDARTIRTTALALCNSRGEYAAPVWAKSTYLLAGIAPPDNKRNVCARVERTKQMKQETHSLFGHTSNNTLKI